jgi:hypothetical protein
VLSLRPFDGIESSPERQVPISGFLPSSGAVTHPAGFV